MNARRAKALRRAARAAQRDWVRRNAVARVAWWARLVLAVLRRLAALGAPGCSAAARRIGALGVRVEVRPPSLHGTGRRAVAPSPRRSLLGVCSRRPSAGPFSTAGGELP